MNYAIILAGGTGTRFWPLSTDTMPKQLLNIYSNKTMLEETIERISSLVRKENIYIAANRIYKEKTKNYLKKSGIPSKNFLFESESKNTLASIGVLSSEIIRKDKRAVVVVLPSDHLIKQKKAFLKAIKKAIRIAEDNFIVTLGVFPKRAEGGFGYIKIKKALKIDNINAYRVERFVEKPGDQKAKHFLKDRKFYWNSGIFIFKASKFLEEIHRLRPAVFRIIRGIKNRSDLNGLWPKFPNISVDYAIMERSKSLALVPMDCGWVDLGSWRAIEEVIKKDKNGNIARGNHIDLGSRGITVWAREKMVATLGLSNLIIVDTKDALLVCAKDKSQKVKEIVKRLKGLK